MDNKKNFIVIDYNIGIYTHEALIRMLKEANIPFKIINRKNTRNMSVKKVCAYEPCKGEPIFEIVRHDDNHVKTLVAYCCKWHELECLMSMPRPGVFETIKI